MKCPKCGYERQPGDHVFVPGTECPACGVVYSKYGSDDQDAQEVSGDKPSGTFKKPSPVHEDSLKQARERVEKRLRAKSTAHLPDEHRKQTMERAKLFVSEGVRKRQAQWRHKKSLKADERGKDADNIENQEYIDTSMVSEQTQGSQPLALEAGDVLQPDVDNGQPAAAQALPQPETTAPAEDNASFQAEEGAAGDQVPMVDAEQALHLDEDGYDQQTEAFSMPAAEIIETMDQSQASASAIVYDAHSLRGKSNGLIRMLTPAAWIVLAAGLVGTILSWTTLGRVYAGPAVSPALSGGGHIPVALLLGFAYLAIGVLGFAFFWVSSMINDQLKEIRRLLMNSSAHEDRPGLSDTDSR